MVSRMARISVLNSSTTLSARLILVRISSTNASPEMKESSESSINSAVTLYGFPIMVAGNPIRQSFPTIRSKITWPFVARSCKRAFPLFNRYSPVTTSPCLNSSEPRCLLIISDRFRELCRETRLYFKRYGVHTSPRFTKRYPTTAPTRASSAQQIRLGTNATVRSGWLGRTRTVNPCRPLRAIAVSPT